MPVSVDRGVFLCDLMGDGRFPNRRALCEDVRSEYNLCLLKSVCETRRT